MEINIVEWNKVENRIVAQLIYDIFTKGNNDWGEKNSPGTIEGYLEEIENDKSNLAVMLHVEGHLIGFVALKVSKSSVEMNPTWLGGDPFISTELDRGELIEVLIAEIKMWALINNLESITFYRNHFESITREYQRIPLERYQSIGFNVREKDVFMGFGLDDYEPVPLASPSGYDVTPIRDVDYEAVYSCFYDTFSKGQSPFFFDQSDRERREYFETWSTPESMESDATIALLSGNEVAAFSFARPYGTPRNYLVEWIGVHPDYRRRGLGTFLMRHIANVAKNGNYETMSLSCATANTNAYALYSRLGWYDDGGETQMAMKLN